MRKLPNCPHCNHELTRAEIRSLFSSYAARQRKTPPRPPQVWKQHSPTARCCKCPDCIERRALRENPAPAIEPPKLSEIGKFNPDDWGDLINHYASVIRHKRNSRAGRSKSTTTDTRPTAKRNRVNAKRRQLRLEGRKKLARESDFLGIIKSRAKSIVDNELGGEVQPEDS